MGPIIWESHPGESLAKRSREHLSKAPEPWERQEKWKENGDPLGHCQEDQCWYLSDSVYCGT